MKLKIVYILIIHWYKNNIWSDTILFTKWYLDKNKNLKLIFEFKNFKLLNELQK